MSRGFCRWFGKFESLHELKPLCSVKAFCWICFASFQDSDSLERTKNQHVTSGGLVLSGEDLVLSGTDRICEFTGSLYVQGPGQLTCRISARYKILFRLHRISIQRSYKGPSRSHKISAQRIVYRNRLSKGPVDELTPQGSSQGIRRIPERWSWREPLYKGPAKELTRSLSQGRQRTKMNTAPQSERSDTHKVRIASCEHMLEFLQALRPPQNMKAENAKDKSTNKC